MGETIKMSGGGLGCWGLILFVLLWSCCDDVQRLKTRVYDVEREVHDLNSRPCTCEEHPR